MDGVYDQNGRPNQAHTDFLISNDYVLKTAQAHPREFLAGVSINPKRRDAVEEVHRCADAGATLVKVIHNAQHNPADPYYKAFYRALALRKLPFLSHVGYEFSLIGKDQSVCDPDRGRVAFDEGPQSLRVMPVVMDLYFTRNFCRPSKTTPRATRISMPISPH